MGRRVKKTFTGKRSKCYSGVPCCRDLNLNNKAAMTERLYNELAEWWPLLSPPEEYAEEAAFYTRLLQGAIGTGRLEVLELGSGGGNNASHMKKSFDLTLVDVSEQMLDVSRELNPECAHLVGDMRSVRLGREFDAVFVHDAICYITTERDLSATFRTAFLHCRPGGAALFCPDHVRENFRQGTDHGGSDGAGRALRYLEWVWDPNPDDSEYFVDMTYVFRRARAEPKVVHERWVEGLFSQERWLELLSEVGFEPHHVGFEHTDGPIDSVVFLAAKHV
jgi:SAM-dependent methyltransferase